MTAFVLTYHGIERRDGPLFVDPHLFAAQLDCIVESGATALTISGLAERLRAGTLPDRAVAITFDDGFRSVAENAAPLLAERGLPATVFCVAGRLGGLSDWPSALPGSPALPLMGADDLRDLPAFEIGSHGMQHDPLVAGCELALEVVESRRTLEEAVGKPVRAFAYPYGAPPTDTARQLVRETYDAACTTSMATVTARADVHALPRIDIHYLRSPQLLKRALAGSLGPYLGARGLAARARRALVKDYA